MADLSDLDQHVKRAYSESTAYSERKRQRKRFVWVTVKTNVTRFVSDMELPREKKAKHGAEEPFTESIHYRTIQVYVVKPVPD